MGRAAIDDVISKLTAEQAVERLARKGGEIQGAVATEVMTILAEIELDAIAEDVFVILHSIKCRIAGTGRAVLAMATRHLTKPYADQEAAYCMGVLFGIYRYA